MKYNFFGKYLLKLLCIILIGYLFILITLLIVTLWEKKNRGDFWTPL